MQQKCTNVQSQTHFRLISQAIAPCVPLITELSRNLLTYLLT